MLITGTEGFSPVQKKNTARLTGAAGDRRTQARGGHYDQVAVSAGQDGNRFREMVASLSYQVRTYNTTGKIQGRGGGPDAAADGGRRVMADGNWGEYLTLLENLGGKLEELTDLERTKALAVGRSDLEELEECMKREQVMSLSLRGLDQKREKLLAALGLTGVPLRDLAERAPESVRMEAKAAAEKLRQKYEVFQSASDVARNTLECNLHAIEKLQKAHEVQPEERSLRQSDFRA